MSGGFESENINPSEDAELIAEEKARQKILEHIKDAELESPRFQSFCDYTDLQNASEFIYNKPGIPESVILIPDQFLNSDMIAETIRQRVNGIKGYREELYQIVDVTRDYWKALKEGRFPARLMAQKVLSSELRKIKEQEIERKS